MPKEQRATKAAGLRRSPKRKPRTTRKVHVIDAKGNRQTVPAAASFVIELDGVEVEVSFPDTAIGPRAMWLSTKNHLLTIGPGHGNGVFVRVGMSLGAPRRR